MKATLVRHEKFIYRRRFVIEISVHQDIDSDEMPYEFRDLDKLISDFRQLIAEHLGVQI